MGQTADAILCELLALFLLQAFSSLQLGADPQDLTVWLPTMSLALWAHSMVPSFLHTHPRFW